MLKPRERNVIRQRVHTRIREKMSGTAERPRLNVYRSLNHIYTQLIDDLNGVTLVSASSFGKKTEEKHYGGNIAAAKLVGKLIAERAQEKGIKKVVLPKQPARPVSSSKLPVSGSVAPQRAARKRYGRWQ